MLPFPEEVPKKPKKTNDFRVLAKARPEFFVVFLGYPSRKIQAFGGKRGHFLRRYQKNKKNKDFRVLVKARPEESKIFFVFCFWFFWYPSRKMQAFGGKRCHFLRKYKIKQKNKDFRVLAKARPEESKIFFVFCFWFFWYPSRKMQAFGGKRCHFLRRYQKNQKNQRCSSLGGGEA